jgi:hypothetical protein
MELPKLIECRRDPGYPPVFDWEQEGMGVYAPYLAFVFSKKSAPGAVGLFFQSADFRQLKKFYVPYFEQFKQSTELLNRVAELWKIYEVRKIYTRLTRPERDFWNFFNSERKHYQRLPILPVPNQSETGLFNYHADLLTQLQTPGRERVFLPEGSEIPSIMAGIPELPGEVSDMDYPAAACVCYGVAALYHYEIKEPEAMEKPKPWRPFSSLPDSYN